MKQFFIVFLLTFTTILHAQSMFVYEREITNKDHFIFQEIDFQNKVENITLRGTLVTPKSDFDKIVVIVPGSGKDTRYAHFILAEELLKNNIAVYRFDERGIGESEGKYSELVNDLATDLELGFLELQKQFPNKKIGIIGHSIGGMASIQIIKNKIVPAFLILIETPIVKNGDFILNQFKNNFEESFPKIMREGKTKDELITFIEGYFKVVQEADSKSLKKEVKVYITEKKFNKRFIVLLDDTFLTEMITTNFEESVENISLKTLYLTGTKDKTINYKKEINKIQSFNNKNIEVEVFNDLNHYLTEKDAKVGTSLYLMDESALNKIIDWTLKR